MAIDNQEKRQAVLGVARPWMRNVFPIATPDEEWRMNVGNTYGGNGLAPPVGNAAVPLPKFMSMKLRHFLVR